MIAYYTPFGPARPVSVHVLRITLSAGWLPRLGSLGLVLLWLTAPPVAAKHVRELLRPDGTLMLGTGFRGSLDVSGFAVELDAARGPVLRAVAPTATGWSALGTGTQGSSAVLALAVIGNDLYVGGVFTAVGGVSASRIAKWNGTSWSALGAGVNSTVNALAVVGSDLYAAGDFSAAGSVSVNYVAKWNGTSWSALGSGLGSAPGVQTSIRALAVAGSDLYAGGNFTTAGGSSANYVAKWNGSSWSALGSGVDNLVYALAVVGSNLYAGGNFTMAGGVSVSRIARWNGSSWSALGSGVTSNVYALAVMGKDFYVGGIFGTAGGISASRVAKWNGSSWSALGSGINNNSVLSLAVVGSNLYAGGNFTTAEGVSASRVAQWNGTSWSALGAGVSSGGNTVYALAGGGSNLYVGGNFTTAGDVSASRIAHWNTLTPLPVTLHYFSGRMTESGALLGWATAREDNNAYFQIERSRDRNAGSGLSFESIATVPTQAVDGNAITELTYSFTDPQPLPGINYYRLSQTDRDGSRTIASTIIALSREEPLTVLFPNPVSAAGEASIEPVITHMGYQISDLLGRIVQRQDAPGVLGRVSLGSLPAGVYLLRVQTQAGSKTFRLVR
jgi:hypothetical protein